MYQIRIPGPEHFYGNVLKVECVSSSINDGQIVRVVIGPSIILSQGT